MPPRIYDYDPPSQLKRAGDVGELLLRQTLERLPDSYQILLNPRLLIQGNSLEYDAIVICPKGAVVLEAKHWRGSLQPAGATTAIRKTTTS